MFLVVGLGNPGKEYEQTRHNVGFMVVDELYDYFMVENSAMRWKNEKHFQSVIAETSFAGQKVFLVKPQTYMNLSGQAVLALQQFYKVQTSQIIVLYDDYDLSLGSLRLRQQGSAGTHNGMRSIVQTLGQDIPRLRVGISLPDFLQEKIPQKPIKDFVLEKFYPEERELKDQTVKKAAQAVRIIIEDGFIAAMDRFN